MRKNLFLTLALAFVTLTGAFAQNWSLTLSAADGLPGKKYTVAADGSISEDGNTMYLYTSDLVTPDAPLNKLRVTFRETQGGNALNGYPFTNLSELQIFEKDGKTLIQYAIGKKDTSFIILDGVTNIGNLAFDRCYNLTSITIPSSVTNIGESGFANCHSLTTVYYTGTESEWNTISIGPYNSDLTNATRYYYSETAPTTEGNYWHYVDGEIVVW